MWVQSGASRRGVRAGIDPVEEFDFEEDMESSDAGQYVWANSAYAMATNINQSFKEYGWCSRIRGVESGGIVENLPVHTFPSDDGGVDMKCPTEIAISDRREAELASSGLMPLIHRKNTDRSEIKENILNVKKYLEEINPAKGGANVSA